MKFALSLAAAAMARRSEGLPSVLLERGGSLLKSSPELSALTENVRGELLGAARTAAATAASNRIDALNDRLRQGIGGPSDDDGEHDARLEDDDTEDETEDDLEDEASDDLEDADDHEDDRADEDEPPRRATRPRPARSRSTAARKSAPRTAQRKSKSGERESTPSRRRARSDSDAAPVRRTRR